jgi:serine/threonine-protein kinase
LKRDVAIKIFHPELPQDAETATSFRQETQAITAVKHPNIMRLYDSGVEGEKYYIVMELVEGTNLRDTLSTHPTGMEREEMLRIFGQLASAVASAHDQNVVHGNIKPDNVLLDKSQRPVLTDFSIPCLREQTPLSGGQSTATYLAPEPGNPTPKSDIYALGILLYEMATNDLPFKGNSYEAVMTQHQNTPLPLPSLINVNIDPRVEQTIVKALSKDPAQRFESAREMIHDLESEEVRVQYETVNLTRDSIPQIQRSHSEITRFQRSRMMEPEEPIGITSVLTQPSPLVMVTAIVAAIVFVAVVAALLL